MMFTDSKKKEDAKVRENFESDSEYRNDEFDASNFYNQTNFMSRVENERTFDSGAYSQSNESRLVNTTNEYASRSTNECASPYKVNKSWNYKAILNDKGYPRIKISTKGNGKKSKSKKSRDPPLYRDDDFSSSGINPLKIRTKIGSDKKSSRKKSFKRQKRLSVPILNNSYNGLSSASSTIASDSNYQNDLVPTQSNIDAELEASVRGKQNHYGNGPEETEYAPQYLELKPSVKFKCCRCGTNDFSTMALLQEHIAKCDGHPSASTTANSLLELSSSMCESGHPYVARNLKIKRKVLLCSSCGTYYQHYNFYVHMRDTHKKEICLFCRSTFSEAQQLCDHLIVAHNLSTMRYSSAAQIRDSFKNFFITCCSCNTIFSDQDEFGEHKCNSTEEKSSEESLDTSCEPANQRLSEDINNEVNQSPDRDFNVNSEDETTSPVNAFGVDERMPTTDSTLHSIGLSNQPSISSHIEEMKSPNQTATVDTKIDEGDLNSESIIPENIEEEAAKYEECKEQPKLEYENSMMKSPLPSSSEAIQEEVDDNENIPADTRTNQESTITLTSQESDQFLAEPEHRADECQERSPSTESLITENALAVKNEEKSSHWLASDDETEDLVETSSHNEVVEQNVEPVEPPQPLAMALMLDESVVSLSTQTLIKECVRTSCDTCLYCNNAILITVNGGQLAAHLRSEHRYMPTKPEDSPEQVVKKIEEAMNDLKVIFMNASLASAYTKFDGTFACLQCSYSTTLFKELCHHKRKLHHKVIFLCIMCKCNFFYYSQLLCHLCPGLYSPEVQNTLNYHCCFCNQDGIPSAFRLMVHLRKIHQACDICLTQYNDQSELFSHMIKQHKMNHLCYKCNLAYRSRDGINEHLYWKHGTESVLCKRCLQKKWPHAYHFCIPASTYTCEECSRIFTRAVALTVHRRAHNGDFPFSCTDCEQKFISKKLLTVHRHDVHNIKPEPDAVDAKTEEPQVEPTQEEKAENSVNDKASKKRKRKRKKGEIDIEKPLLDDLPPLNLSSESEEESDDEASVEKSLPSTADKLASTDEEIESKDNNSVKSTDPAIAIPPDGSVAPESLPPNTTEEAKSDETESLSRNDLAESLPEIGDSADRKSSPKSHDSTVISACTEENPSESNTDSLEVGTKTNEMDVPNVDAENVEIIAPDVNAADSCAPNEETSGSQEQMPEVSIERILNCLMIEHSYCIPDSIFYSEGADADNSLEKISERLSPKMCGKSREKTPGCKSVTPRKRKHPPKRDSSSSDSSSESDSSSSSCGSNCSCNQKSNSNCSSSSSGSDCSTTPDKKHSKKSTDESRKDATVVDDQNESKNEQDSLLNIRESDLDTDIETSDEDFYDKYPSSAPRVGEKPESPTLHVPTILPTQPIPSMPKKRSSFSKSRKSDKRRRAPKIKISLGPQNNGTCVTTDVSLSSQPFDSSIQSTPTYRPAKLKNSRPGIHLCKTDPVSPYTSTPNNISNEVRLSGNSFGTPGDDSDRRSKRERVKNKFYGYSSSDDGGTNNESLKVAPIKKRLTSKRPPKVPTKQPFVGIRAKKPAIVAPKRPHSASSMSTMAVAHPSLPPHLYRMPSYIMQQQHQQQQLQVQHLQRQQEQQFPHQRQYQQSSSSSDDSDSDNLVINEPTLNDRSTANRPKFRFPIYPPAEPSTWSRSNLPESTPASAGPSGPTNEKLYCYCQCPYDEVSEMIGCDGENCKFEWFHFECVGIMVPPKGAWYCPQCKNREAVPQFM